VDPSQAAQPRLVGSWAERLEVHGLKALRDCPEMHPLRVGVRRFLYLRHGETAGNASRTFQAPDTPLNDNGRAQAAFAAGLLDSAGVGRIHASSMHRAWETALIVGKQLGIEPTAEQGLRERLFGDWVGTPSGNLNWGDNPPNGETVGQFVSRTLAAFESVLSKPADGPGDILVIAHGGNLYALAFSLNVALAGELIQNATPLIFTRHGDGWEVTAIPHSKDAEPPKKINMGW
jgi:probable phosphoglycerate mutase